ncbi:hypothetical protein LG3211_0527 [Lysobacter gummosus]|nr:hypothetical protein LG3211_0527 [Lysobacter gummosus]
MNATSSHEYVCRTRCGRGRLPNMRHRPKAHAAQATAARRSARAADTQRFWRGACRDRSRLHRNTNSIATC